MQFWSRRDAKMTSSEPLKETGRSQQILGIKFFDGDVDEAIATMSQNGGYMVAPSGTCFARLQRDRSYREAITHADLAIADSGAMVLLWRFLHGNAITRISGLKYLQALSARLFTEKRNRVLWVLPSEEAREKTARWLRANQFGFTDINLHVAPRYGSIVEDRQLLTTIENQKPDHVIIGIGSYAQEKLGLYLRDHLSFRPAIHCIGAALGFLTGDQAAIPAWADQLFLGWFLRLLRHPQIFIPRLTRALPLPWLIWKYGENLPPFEGEEIED